MKWQHKVINGRHVYLMHTELYEPAAVAWVERLARMKYQTGGRFFTIENKEFKRLIDAKNYCVVQYVEFLGYLGEK